MMPRTRARASRGLYSRANALRPLPTPFATTVHGSYISLRPPGLTSTFESTSSPATPNAWDNGPTRIHRWLLQTLGWDLILR